MRECGALPGSSQLVHDGMTGLGVDIRDDDGCAFAREQARCRRALPAAGSGNDGDLTS